MFLKSIAEIMETRDVAAKEANQPEEKPQIVADEEAEEE